MPIRAASDAIAFDGHRVGFSNCDSPGQAPWREAGVEMVLECSGKFLTPRVLAPYFTCGVRKVVVAGHT